MAQTGDVAARSGTSQVTDQQPAQPSSPAGSTSSKDEKTAREKLKETSIAGLKQQTADGEIITTDESSARLDPNDVAGEIMNSNGTRGRPAKKRSFEDLAKDDAAVDAADNSAQPPEPKSGHHKRMRSRDIATGDQVPAYTKIEGEKSETVHEESDMDAQISPGGPGVLVDAPSQEEMEQDEAIQPAKSKNEPTGASTIENKLTSKISSGSGFANASTSSPFGQTKSPPKDESEKDSGKITSPSAFASSGLSAFASTEKSPFGIAASSKSPGGFGGGQAAGGFGSSKGGFGSSTGFGAPSSSAFGSGGGFGSTKTFGSSSSAFGVPKPFGSTTAFGTGGPGSGGFGTGKPFTSTADKVEEEEREDEDDEDSASVAKDDTDQDPRFHEQQGKFASPAYVFCANPGQSIQVNKARKYSFQLERDYGSSRPTEYGKKEELAHSRSTCVWVMIQQRKHKTTSKLKQNQRVDGKLVYSCELMPRIVSYSIRLFSEGCDLVLQMAQYLRGRLYIYRAWKMVNLCHYRSR